MQKSNVNHSAAVAHRRTQASTTLNRRYVRRPSDTMMASQTNQMSQMKQMSQMDQANQAKQMGQDTDVKVSIKRSPKIKRFDTSAEQQQMQKQMQKQQQMQEPMQPAEMHPMQKTTQTKMRERQNMMTKQQMQSNRMTAKELKDQAIKKALMSAATSDMKEQQTITSKKSEKKMGKMKFGFGRVMLALSCATAVVFAIAYFVNLNMPDISLRVAAMQTGIDATYPSYVPRDYNVAGITSENGKVVLDFHNNSGESFTLEEETSSWDSNALLTNYVKDAFNNEYSIIREQGLTIYIKGSNATWVNGGIVYKLKANDGVLTNKQIRSIAVSL